MSRYRLYVTGEKTDHVVEGTSPAKALRTLADLAGETLADQDGRYGHLVDGRYCAAYTEPWDRRKLDPYERTTRVA